jgi:hypothetical protein
MKIEILTLTERLTEKCTGMTCFEASKHVANAINDCNHIYGIVLIDDVAVKFSFSPYFMDGDIFTECLEHRVLIKHLIPLYVYNNIDKYKKVYTKTGQ